MPKKNRQHKKTRKMEYAPGVMFRVDDLFQNRMTFYTLVPEINVADFLKKWDHPEILQVGAIHFFEDVEPCFYVCLKSHARIVEEQMGLGVKVIREMRVKDESVGRLSTLQLYGLLLEIYDKAVELVKLKRG